MWEPVVTWNSSLRVPNILFRLSWAVHTCGTQAYMQTEHLYITGEVCLYEDCPVLGAQRRVASDLGRQIQCGPVSFVKEVISEINLFRVVRVYVHSHLYSLSSVTRWDTNSRVTVINWT